ncbi:MAG: rhomboid family intramembrane serine protease [Candidatus Latescibacteria bacterium]|nr:rhomboid family intramembrane serine protease [Candidatus Latescibacterota bacterium]NIO54797.1 rhomboid family intramembrane serine protease [Candidatus Latescibacterota bacterium]
MRTYYYHGRRPLAGGNFTSGVVGRLILANVLIYILQLVLPVRFSLLLALTPRVIIEDFYIWQIFTYMFLHGGFWHLFFNMLMLFMFGSTLESVWGGRRFLNYYVACGIGGAVFSFIFNYNNLILGASGAIFGVFLAYAMIFPDNIVYLQFLFPVKAKHLIVFFAALQIAMGLSGPSGIAFFAHLGGMAAGLIFFRKQIANSKWVARARRRWSDYSRRKRGQWEAQEDANIDSILDKITAKGYEKLSATEKRILENYSKKSKEDSGDT